MSGTTAHNGQIPTDPYVLLLVTLTAVSAVGQFASDPSEAVASLRDLAEFAVAARLLYAGR